MRWPKKSKTCVTSNGGAASDATVTGSYRLHEVDDVRATTVIGDGEILFSEDDL